MRCYRDHGDHRDDDDDDDDGVDHDEDDDDVDDGGGGGGHGDDVDGGGDDDQVLLNLALCFSLNRNFDGVLAVMKPTDLESYMRSEMMMMHHAMISCSSSSSSSCSSSSSIVMDRKCSDTSVSLPTGHTYSFKSDTSRSSSSISPLPSGTHTTKGSTKSSPVDLSISAKSSASSSSRCSSSCKNKESSHTRMLETSSDVLKSMKAVRKKLATIAELVDKLQ